MITKNQNRIVFIIVLIASVTIVTVQYLRAKNKQERLQKLGQHAQIVTSPTIRYGVNSVDYYFLTSTGFRVEGSQKCPGGCSKYTNATVVYNPNDPYEFEFMFDFELYDPVYRIIFFFVIYLCIMTGVLYGFTRFGIRVYSKFIKREA